MKTAFRRNGGVKDAEMPDECCICGNETPDGFDHEECYDQGTIRADEVEE